MPARAFEIQRMRTARPAKFQNDSVRSRDDGSFVDSSWNVMAHGDAREGKWRENWRMEWVATTLHTTSEHGVSIINTADAHTSTASSRWTDAHVDLNGLVLFAERRNLVSARVPSHFKRSLLHIKFVLANFKDIFLETAFV